MIRIPNYLRPSVCLGIHINDASIHAIAMDQLSKPHQPLWSNKVSSETPLLTGANGYSALKAKLSELSNNILSYANEQFPIQLALADPVISNYFLEFESLPGSYEECQRLVTWQLSKQYHLDCNNLALTFQHMGEHDGKQLVYVLGIERLLIDSIMEVMQDADLAPTVLDAGASYLYNVLPRVAPTKNAMAINMEDSYWSIIIWDENATLQYLRSKWYDINSSLSGSYQKIIREIERTARAFVHQKEGRSINAIHLCGDEVLTSALREQFHDSVQVHCTTHKGNNIFAGHLLDDEHPGWTLLAASLCRNS